MTALFTKEAKDAIGPLALRILIVIASIAGGVAIYHITGGERIPFFSDVTPYILGIVAFLVIEKNLRK